MRGPRPRDASRTYPHYSIRHKVMNIPEERQEKTEVR